MKAGQLARKNSLTFNQNNRPFVAGGRRLKFTRQEADQILAEARGAKNLRAIDFKANRATATGGELSKYRYVHFATHGYIDSERSCRPSSFR